ncbi:YdcF family protein [Pirellulaceae bacterium SH501]
MSRNSEVQLASPRSTEPPGSWIDWISSFVQTSSLVVALPLIIAATLGGKSVVEKVLTAITQPLYITIFAILWIGGVMARRRQVGIARIARLLALVLWIVSCEYTKDSILRTWESLGDSRSWDSLPEYDYVVVLGGGTSKRPDGNAQLGDAGDRVATAARLYHRGLVKHLVTTGDVLPLRSAFAGEYEEEDKPTSQTIQLWKELGIPEERILFIGGQNTSAEMTELAEHSEWWRDKKCAILTSAMHLPRALQLAKARGITADGIASDYQASTLGEPLNIQDFIPNQGALKDLHLWFKEWIAMQIGR